MQTNHARADAVIFQRRNRLRRHFVTTSNVLLYGYPQLSDAAKITYQVIDGFDWESKETGDSKGYVFPAVETLATIRRTTVRTIQRHFKELEAANLLTRQRRRYQPSILFIEDVSDEEGGRYLAQYVEKQQPPTAKGERTTSRTDKNVVSHSQAEPTKVSVVYKQKQEKGKEDEINVNVDKNRPHKAQRGIDAVGALLSRYEIFRPRSVESSDSKAKQEHLAQTLAEQLNDRKSIGCYRVLAEKIPATVLFETLASVKEQLKDGRIRTRPGAVFVEVVKQFAQAQGIVLGFRQKERGAAARLSPPATAHLRVTQQRYSQPHSARVTSR